MMKNGSEFTHLWILGCQSSRTTFVGESIARHPNLGVTIHGKIAYYAIQWILRDPSFDGHHVRLDEMAYSLSRMPILNLDDAQIAKVTTCLESRFPPNLLEKLSPSQCVKLITDTAYREIFPTASIVGDKYNEYILSLVELNTCFPRSFYLFIHRDPHEAADSMLRKLADRPWCPQSIERAIEKWASWNMKWLLFRDLIPSHQYLEIGDRDFLKNIPGVLAEVFSKLGVEKDDQAIAYAVDRARLPEDKPADPSPLNIEGEIFEQVKNKLGYR